MTKTRIAKFLGVLAMALTLGVHYPAIAYGAASTAATGDQQGPSAIEAEAQALPGKSGEGVLAEMEDGTTVQATNADQPFNPASAMKVATALLALRRLGAEHEFNADRLPALSKLRIGDAPYPLTRVLHAMLSYSDNAIAEELGRQLGGPAALEKFLVDELGLPDTNLAVATTSGLGSNRLTPVAMLYILREFVSEAEKQGVSINQLLPVAGIAPGTIAGRFAGSDLEGAFVGKTGTLHRTDGGASALVGIASTKSGLVYFVIFHKHGQVSTFRQRQNRLIHELVDQMGGAEPKFVPPLVPVIPVEKCGQERALA